MAKPKKCWKCGRTEDEVHIYSNGQCRDCAREYAAKNRAAKRAAAGGGAAAEKPAGKIRTARTHKIDTEAAAKFIQEELSKPLKPQKIVMDNGADFAQRIGLTIVGEDAEEIMALVEACRATPKRRPLFLKMIGERVVKALGDSER